MDDPDLGIWKYEYDLAGNLVNQTDNAGDSLILGYDSLNRILYKNGTTKNISFSYDQQYQGTLSSVNYTNISYSYVYDKRLRATEEHFSAFSRDFITGMAYDSTDRILETHLPDGEDFDYYYNLQGKIAKVHNYVNQSYYNPFGNPLNRSFFNQKLTAYSYDAENARLRQIKTDSSQILNYSYDSVGNVLKIDDQANSRLYSMSYDNLDRLTNVTINSFTWLYSYDALGRVLKVIKNNSVTTALKYENSVLHFPSDVIDFNTSVDVYRETSLNTSSKSKVFSLYLINEKNSSLQDVSWIASFDDGQKINSTQDFNLTKKENVLVIVEHTYSSGGNYIINFTGRTGNAANDYELLNLLFGAKADSLKILEQNATTIITQFDAKNTLSEIFLNWNWQCNNGIVSSEPFNMSANENLIVIMEHNYSI